jgi:hypothetical protein
MIGRLPEGLQHQLKSLTWPKKSVKVNSEHRQGVKEHKRHARSEGLSLRPYMIHLAKGGDEVAINWCINKGVEV